MKEQAEQQIKCTLNFNLTVLANISVLVESSPRMPKSNGSVFGPGAPEIFPRIGSQQHREGTTPLIGPPTPYGRL